MEEDRIGLRRVAKAVGFLFGFALALPAIVLVWLEKALTKSELVFAMCCQFSALIPGPLGVSIRSAYYAATLDQCSWEVHIGFGSMIVHRGAELEPRVSTGAYCVIGHARIGTGVRIASHVSIPSGKRQHVNSEGDLVATTAYESVSIGPSCWIGEGAIILADVGASSIVSAGAVVVTAAPDNCILGGNPARILKQVSIGHSTPDTDQ
ncbi:MAG: acyltransferase [Rhodothermales bacterium]|nr:acyltransferase [Rhodothermales bacterium]